MSDHLLAVVFQPFFTIDTSRYFKMSYSESLGKFPSTTNNKSSVHSRPPPPLHPPPKSKMVPRTNETVSETTAFTETTEVTEEVKRTPSPATGQVVADQQQSLEEQEENTDGNVCFFVCFYANFLGCCFMN